MDAQGLLAQHDRGLAVDGLQAFRFSRWDAIGMGLLGFGGFALFGGLTALIAASMDPERWTWGGVLVLVFVAGLALAALAVCVSALLNLRHARSNVLLVARDGVVVRMRGRVDAFPFARYTQLTVQFSSGMTPSGVYLNTSRKDDKVIVTGGEFRPVAAIAEAIRVRLGLDVSPLLRYATSNVAPYGLSAHTPRVPEHPALVTCRDAIGGGDYSGFNRWAPTLREGQWASRQLALDAAAEASLSEEALTAWCNNEPGTPLPFLLRATVHLRAAEGTLDGATDARASGVAPLVARRGAARLAECERDLRHAAQLDPADPTPAALMLDALRLQGRTVAEAQPFFDHARRAAPGHWGTDLAMVRLLAARSGGVAALEYARTIATQSAPGSLAPMLVVAAHVEQWRAAQAHASAYAAQPAVREECRAAIAAVLGSPQWSAVLEVVPASSLAVFWMWLVGAPEEAARLYATTPFAPRGYPWSRAPAAAEWCVALPRSTAAASR